MQSPGNDSYAKIHFSLVTKYFCHLFTRKKLIAIPRKSATTKEHVAPNGKTRNQFEFEAATVNATKKCGVLKIR